MMNKLVTISGEWERANTWPGDVAVMRRSLKENIEKLGGTLRVSFSRSRSEVDGGVKRGAFAATLPIAVIYGTNPQKAGRIARKLLEAVLLQQCCVPPKIKVTDYATVSLYGIQETII